MLHEYPPWTAIAEEGYRPENALRSDIVDGYLPQIRPFRDALREGDLANWNPGKAQGRPLATVIENTVFHPLVLAFTVVFPLDRGFSLLVMAKMLLAGLFMYFFLRKLELSRSAGVLGGAAYMFSGFNVVWLMWPHTLVSVFAPFLFIHVENLARDPRLHNVALLAVSAAIMVLGGFPAVAAYFFIAAGLYYLVRAAQLYRRERDLRRVWARVAAFAGGFTLAAGVTGFQLIPTLEYTEFIDLGARRALAERELPHSALVQLVFPNFNGNQVFGNYAGPLNLNETSGYVGTVTIGLATVGVAAGLMRRRAAPVYFGALASACVLAVYGIGPLLDVLAQLPVFNVNPNTRLLSVFGFSAAALGAFGLEELLRLGLKGMARTATLMALALAIAAAAGGLAYLGVEAFERRDAVHGFFNDFPVMELRAFRVITVGFAIVTVLGALSVLAAHLYLRLPARAVAGVIIALVALDLLVFSYRQNPTIPTSRFYPETPAIEFLRVELEPQQRIAPFDGTFMVPGTQLYYGISSAFSHALHDERQRRLIEAFSENAFKTRTAVIPQVSRSDFGSPVVDLLGVRYLTFRPGTGPVDAADRYRRVYASREEIDIYEYERYVDAFLAPRLIVEEEPENALRTVTAEAFDPHVSAVIEEEPPDWFPQAPAGPVTGFARVTEYRPDRVTYGVVTSAPALLVTHEMYYPGWRATVDGEDARVYRANYIFRGVFVEAGAHTVTFEFAPNSFRLGVLVTLVSLGVMVAFLVYGPLVGRSEDGGTPPGREPR